jgi:hypothetical protein
VDASLPRRCRGCSDAHREIAKKAIEDAEIDWGAIEWAVQDIPVRLTGTEKRLAVRRILHRLVKDDQGVDYQHIPAGKRTTQQVAEQFGCHKSAIQQIVHRMPKAVESVCPMCRGRMWILAESADCRLIGTKDVLRGGVRVRGVGLVEDHGDGGVDRCRMSGRLGRQVVGLHPVPQALLVLRCYALEMAS